MGTGLVLMRVPACIGCMPYRLQVFPRPKLDAALEARRLEREEATRQAKANLSKRPGKTGFAVRVPSKGQLAGPGVCLLVERGLLRSCWACVG